MPRSKKWYLLPIMTATLCFLFSGCTIAHIEPDHHSKKMKADQNNGSGIQTRSATAYQNDKKVESNHESGDNTVDNLEEKKDKKPPLNPFGGRQAKGNVTPSQLLEYIHYMSHQKVKAQDKWGFYKITDKRINWLLDDMKKSGYGNDSDLVKILKRWKKGDFSHSVQDHNLVWKILGGTKENQKATRLLTKQEEQHYIEHTKQIYPDK